jgi:Polyketide cyclase / dehydrase and lipid transport
VSTTVRAAREVVLPPEEAEQLWLDVTRWPTFIEGFAHVLERDASWPEAGSKLVWESLPGGRGRVNEKVLSREEGELATRLVEDSMHGVQTVSFHPADGGGAIVELELRYDLNPTTIWRQGPLGAVTNLLFIRRAITDSLIRTLRRFATEAAEERSL